MLARVAGATHSGEKRPNRRHHQDNASHCPRKTEDGRASRREVMHDSCITTQRRVSLRLCQCNLFSGKDRPRMQCILYALGITWCFQVGKHCSETSGTLYCGHPCHPYTTKWEPRQKRCTFTLFSRTSFAVPIDGPVPFTLSQVPDSFLADSLFVGNRIYHKV